MEQVLRLQGPEERCEFHLRLQFTNYIRLKHGEAPERVFWQLNHAKAVGTTLTRNRVVVAVEAGARLDS